MTEQDIPPVGPASPARAAAVDARPERPGVPRLLKLLVLVPVVVLLLIFAAIGFLSSLPETSVRTVRAVGGDRLGAITDGAFIPTVELHTGATFEDGHALEILLNGDGTYPRLWADLRSARHTITAQVYYCNPGALSDTLTSILLERAAAGVRVLFLPDAFGCSLDNEVEALRRGGVFASPFRPLRWYDLHRTQHRAHSRTVIIDGRVAYTGGFGIDDAWFGDGRTPGYWRDTNVRYTGPAVWRHQAAFAAAWAEATGELLTGEELFPKLEHEAGPDGAEAADSGAEPGASAALIHTVPTPGSTGLERLYALTLTGATSRLWITNAYFVPDDTMVRLLRDAARRGVDVRILSPDEQTDQPTVRYAGRARFRELLEGGVRIFEYRASPLHAKSIVADGVWSAIGSANFDNRSIAMNNETVFVVRDSAVAAALEAVFLDDLTRSEEIVLERFRRRGLYQRVRERIAGSVADWL